MDTPNKKRASVKSKANWATSEQNFSFRNGSQNIRTNQPSPLQREKMKPALKQRNNSNVYREVQTASMTQQKMWPDKSWASHWTHKSNSVPPRERIIMQEALSNQETSQNQSMQHYLTPQTSKTKAQSFLKSNRQSKIPLQNSIGREQRHKLKEFSQIIQKYQELKPRQRQDDDELYQTGGIGFAQQIPDLRANLIYKSKLDANSMQSQVRLNSGNTRNSELHERHTTLNQHDSQQKLSEKQKLQQAIYGKRATSAYAGAKPKPNYQGQSNVINSKSFSFPKRTDVRSSYARHFSANYTANHSANLHKESQGTSQFIKRDNARFSATTNIRQNNQGLQNDSYMKRLKSQAKNDYQTSFGLANKINQEDGKDNQLLQQRSKAFTTNDSKNVVTNRDSVFLDLFNALQEKDLFGKEQEFQIVKKHQANPHEMSIISGKVSPTRERMVNPKVSIFRQPKAKSNQRKAFNCTYLSKFERRQEEEKERTMKLIAEEFEKSLKINQKQPYQEIDDSEDKAMQKRLKAMIRQATIQAEQERKDIEAKDLDKRIKSAFNDSMRNTQGVITDINNREVIDEIYSQSDASNYREEEMLIDIDNQIQEDIDVQFDQDVSQSQKFSLANQGGGIDNRRIMLQNNFVALSVEKDKKVKDQRATKLLKFKEILAKYQQTAAKIIAPVQTVVEDQQEETKKTTKLQQFPQILGDQGNFVTDFIDNIGQTLENVGQDRLYVVNEDNLDDLGAQFVSQTNISNFNKAKSFALVQNARQLVGELKFYEIGQRQHQDTFSNVLKNDQMVVYQNTVNQVAKIHPVVQLNLSRRLLNEFMIFQNYTLDQGHVKGFAQMLIKTGKPKFTSILLNNCGIDDDESETLFGGLEAKQDLELLDYRNNEFKRKALESIKPILRRQDPHNLLTLKLQKCATSPLFIGELIQFMNEENVHLRSLNLIQMQLNSSAMENISEYLKKSQFLEDLNLSWNNLRPSDFECLFPVLGSNRTLRSVNLSSNMIIDKKDQNNKFSLTVLGAMDDYVKRRQAALKSGQSDIQDAREKQDHPMQFIYSFCKLIRFNKQIQTIILDNTGLNSQVIAGLVPALRHAKSLLCLHLTSNPGINQEIVNYYIQRLRPTLQQETDHYKVPMISENLDYLTKAQQASMTPMEIKVHNYKVQNADEWRQEEVKKYEMNKKMKAIFDNRDTDLFTDKSDLTMTRVLGHSMRMKGSAQWRLMTQQEDECCWVCDSWIYTLYFWNRDIGSYNDVNQVGITMESKKQLVKTVREINPDTYMDYEDVPVLFSEATNWKPRPFMTLFDFLDTLEPGIEPDYDTIALDAAKQEFGFTDIRFIDPAQEGDIEAFLKGCKQELCDEYVKMRLMNSSKIVKEHLRYKKPNLINFDKISGCLKADMWVQPIFLKPGKCDFLIRTPKDKQKALDIEKGRRVKLSEYNTPIDGAYDFHYKRHIVKLRQEKIPIFTKELKIAEHSAKFVKSLSVFKDWQEDNEEIITNSMKHDLKVWKIGRVYKPQIVSRLQELFKGVFARIKEIFIVAAYESFCPDLRMVAFGNFLKKAGVYDQKFTQSIADTLFVATNYEVVDNDNNDDKSLQRHEFLEILVRVAQAKYKEELKEQHDLIVHAVQWLLNTHIFPMQGLQLSWSGFREKELWTLDVSELLEVNIRGIRKLYDFIAKSQFNTKKNRVQFVNNNDPSIDQVRAVLGQGAIPECGEKSVIKAFYMSKMTVVEESDDSNYEYTYLHWPEFIEFIGRLAQVKFRGKYQEYQWALKKKISSILDCVLKVVDEERVDPPEMRDVISDSDDDY